MKKARLQCAAATAGQAGTTCPAAPDETALAGNDQADVVAAVTGVASDIIVMVQCLGFLALLLALVIHKCQS